MPKGVNERVWKRAKAAAAESGQADNYAYVMAVYKRMMNTLEKARKGEAIPGSKYISRKPDGKGGWTYKYPRTSRRQVKFHGARAESLRERSGPAQMPLPYKESPRRVGPVTADMTRDQVEEAIRDQDYEHLVAFVEAPGDTPLPQGQVYRARGTKKSVFVPSDVIAAWRANGEVVLTHNHPSGASLSQEDIFMAIGADLAEIRAVTRSGGVWRMTRPEQGWGHEDGLDSVQVRGMLDQAMRMSRLRACSRMDAVVKAAGGNPDDGPSAKGFTQEVWNEIWTEEWFDACNNAFRAGVYGPKLDWKVEYSGPEHFDWQRDRARRQLRRNEVLDAARAGEGARAGSGGLGGVVSKAVRRPPGRGWGRIPKPRGGRLGWRRPDGKGGYEYRYDDELGGQLDLFSQMKRRVASALPTVLKAPISQVIAVAKRASSGKEYTSVVQYDPAKPWTAPDWSPDLASYDHILVNTSAGKDSQAMLDYMVQLADEQGVDRGKIVAIHADLGQVEWERTKELAKQQADAYGVRFEWVQREQGDLLDQVRDRYHRLHQRLTDADALRAAGVETFEALAELDRAAVIEIIGEKDEKWTRAFGASKRAQQLLTGARKKTGPIDFGTPIPWPSSQARYCTSDQKTSQIKKWINANTGQNGHERVLNCLGIRAGESPARAKKPGWIEGKTDTRKRQVDQWYPIFGWSERRVWDTIAESGVPHHEAYNKGMGRLSCVFCVFAPKSSLITAAMHNPELFETYLELEREVGYQFSANTSLEDVAAEVAKRRRELAETDGVLPVRSTEEIVGGASLTKALEGVVDLAPISMALVQGLTALRGQASVVVQWRDHGCCIHLRSGDDDYHLAWYEGNQAHAASILAMSMAGDWGVPFEEHGQIPPNDDDPLTKAGARPPGRGWMRIPKQRAGSRPGWRRWGSGAWEYRYDTAPSKQPGLFRPDATHFWSGSSRPNNIRAARANELPIGVVAGELSPQALEALRDNYGEPGSPAVFVDSGEFNAFQSGRVIDDAEWDDILERYDTIARDIGESAHVVAPDAIGDQAETLRRMRRAAERLYDLTTYDAKVLVPLQSGDMPIREFAAAAFDALGAYEGDPEYVPAFPMKAKALEVDAAVEYLREERPPAVHFLGLGMRSKIKAPDGRRVVDVLLDAVRKYSPDTRVTMDSNVMRAKLGRGRVATVALEEAREQIMSEAAPTVRTVGDARILVPGGLERVMNAVGAPHMAFSPSQLRSIARRAGLRGDELKAFARAPHRYRTDDLELDRKITTELERAAFRIYFERPLTGEAQRRQYQAVVEDIAKAVPQAYRSPPPGYTPTPGSRIGTYRKYYPGRGWDYWKPGDPKLYQRMGDQGAPKPGEKGYRPPPDRGDALDGRSPVEVARTALEAADRLMNDPMFPAAVSLDPDYQASWFPDDDEVDHFLRDEIVAEGELADLLELPNKGKDGEPARGTEARSDLAHQILELAAASRVDGGLPPEWVNSRYVQQGIVLPRWAAEAVLADRLEKTSPRKMRLVLVDRDEAKAFIEKHHSELPYINERGLIYSIGIMRGDRLTAVATAGHPTGHTGRVDPRNVVELTRVASDGTTQGAASKLTKRIMELTEKSKRGDQDAPSLFVTYQFVTESGNTYKALAKRGLRPVAYIRGQKPSGARAGSGDRAQPTADKIRWEAGSAAGPARWDLLESKKTGPFSSMVQKALAPPKGGGWTPIPNSRSGGWHRRVRGKFEHWYPEAKVRIRKLKQQLTLFGGDEEADESAPGRERRPEVTVMSMGLGRDSMTMLALAKEGKLMVDGEALSGDDLDAVVFADPGWEWPHTYALLPRVRQMCKQMNVPFYHLRKPPREGERGWQRYHEQRVARAESRDADMAAFAGAGLSLRDIGTMTPGEARAKLAPLITPPTALTDVSGEDRTATEMQGGWSHAEILATRYQAAAKRGMKRRTDTQELRVAREIKAKARKQKRDLTVAEQEKVALHTRYPETDEEYEARLSEPLDVQSAVRFEPTWIQQARRLPTIEERAEAGYYHRRAPIMEDYGRLCKITLRASAACTANQKINPINSKLMADLLADKFGSNIQEWTRDVKAGRRPANRVLIGIAADETHRLAGAEAAAQEQGPVKARHPLVDMGISKAGEAEILKRHGLNHTRKSGCMGCHFQPLSWYWALKESQPDSYAQIVEFERRAIDYAQQNGMPVKHLKGSQPLDEQVVKWRDQNPEATVDAVLDKDYLRPKSKGKGKPREVVIEDDGNGESAYQATVDAAKARKALEPVSFDDLLEKRITPPAGYSLAPRSKIGAYRKRKGKGWVYWDPRGYDKRLPGGDEWWRHYGMRAPMGDWDGTWADTSTDDPAAYDKQGVLEASDRMLALREARIAGNLPVKLLEAAALFAITSKRTQSEKQARIWDKADAWLEGETRDLEELRAIMRPLGLQNSRLSEMKSVLSYIEGMRETLLRHPTDGRAARRELMAKRQYKGLGVAKMSFVLELMGYTDVACIDSVVSNYLTGDRSPEGLATKLSQKIDLYEAFEDALGRSQAYRESDPEAVRLGMAQWRAWDHHRGSDTDHAVFWDSARRIMGDIIKAADTPDLMAAVLGYAVDRFGMDHPVWYHVHRGE